MACAGIHAFERMVRFSWGGPLTSSGRRSYEMFPFRTVFLIAARDILGPKVKLAKLQCGFLDIIAGGLQLPKSDVGF